MLEYSRPDTIEEAVSTLNQSSGAALLYAGGTDLLPRWSKGDVSRPGSILDLKGVRDLSGVSRNNGLIRVGACTTISEVESDPVVRSTAPVLSEAAGRIACPQVRNRATIGGNLCNASPAADTAIPLILLDAVLELASATPGGVASRNIPIAEFFCGPGATVRKPDEVLTYIRFAPLPAGAFAAWNKFGTRPSMEIAVASVGVALRFEGGTVAHARVGYGSVAPTPLRGLRAEEQLLGKALSAAVIGKCVAAATEEITPITDVRAGEAYRREVVGVMLRRLLDRAADA